MTISVDAEKAFDNIQYLLIKKKNSPEYQHKRNLPQHSSILEKQTTQSNNGQKT